MSVLSLSEMRHGSLIVSFSYGSHTVFESLKRQSERFWYSITSLGFSIGQ
jgi:hypothetical protein